MTIANHRLNVTDRVGFRKLLGNVSGTTPWPSSFGSSFNTFFKPFTTSLTADGIPHYQRPVLTLIPSGKSLLASSTGLNPFGYHTYDEGLLWGSSSTGNIDNGLDPLSVRSHGIKTPLTLVGWGYDIFGYPAPNAVTGWTRNGNYGSQVSPSSLFTAVTSGHPSTGNKFYTDNGANVFLSEWLAAPLDVRFDINRKVWVPPNSVYSAHVTKIYINGSPSASVSDPQFIENVRYDVAVFDGIANQTTITNVYPVSPKPAPSSFKIMPLSSGDFCFLVHTNVSGRPSFGVYTNEQPGSEECLSSATGATSNLLSLSSSTGNVRYDTLSTTPLAQQYGGIGYSSYNNRQAIISSNSGILKKYTVQVGSGLMFTFSENSSSTGSWTIALSTGVNFTLAGVNTSITELQGLVTPLSIAQGGTNSTTKNFVDLTTSQSVSGTKSFISPLKSSYYSSSGYIAGYTFSLDPNAGLFYLQGSGIGIMSSGQPMIQFSSGCVFRQQTLFNPNSGNSPVLTVQQYNILSSGDTSIQVWKNNSGTKIAGITNSGTLFCQGLESTGINYKLPPTGGFIATNSQATGYFGNIDVGHPTTTGIRRLNIVNGLIIGYTDL